MCAAAATTPSAALTTGHNSMTSILAESLVLFKAS